MVDYGQEGQRIAGAKLLGNAGAIPAGRVKGRVSANKCEVLCESGRRLGVRLVCTLIAVLDVDTHFAGRAIRECTQSV